MKQLSNREKRHFKIRKYLSGTEKRPRLTVYRSAKYIYAQLIDDGKGATLVANSDLKTDKKGTKTQKAFEVGKQLATKAIKIGIIEVVFDRGGFVYRGRVAELARGAREGGLKF